MRFPRIEPLMVGLTLVNIGVLGATLLREKAVAAPAQAADGVLRGRGLEIVDTRGKVRASIAIHPAAKQPYGSVYPETVLLRLITTEGRPVVKISSSQDGAGMALSAAEGPAYVQILSRENDPSLVIVNGAGKQISTLP